MPNNQNASYRYQILDRCFSHSTRKYDFYELLEAVNERLYDVRGRKSEISERQLRDDIKAIRNMLPIDVELVAKPFDGKKCYYRYSDSSFSIYNNELSAEEVQNLRTTIEMLRKYRGLPSNGWLDEVISNLEFRFGVNSNNESLISFGQNDQLQGFEFLSELIEATINHQPLLIAYKTYKGEEYEQTVHPYYMRPYNNRWFLFGLNAELDKISNYALDRIQSIEKANVRFIPNTTIDFVTYFKDIIGVSVPQNEVDRSVEDIVLRFSERRIPYVLSKPVHASQEQLSNTDIVLHVYPTRELMQQIFSYGPDVEVVSPAWYRAEIMKKYEEIYKKYFPMQKACTDAS